MSIYNGETMTRQDVVVYGTKWCSDCVRSKRFLDSNQIQYKWVDIEDKPEGKEYVLKVNNGKRIVPTITFSDGSFLTEPTDTELAIKLAKS
tara:strand:- start:422 stop:694 length:273 start_codon:yes stop_codon:yes gene_type:complete